MSLTLSGTNGVVGAGFTVDASGVSVTAGVGTFGRLAAPAAGLTGALPALSAASLTQIPAANIVGVCTSGLTKTGGFGGGKFESYAIICDQKSLGTDGGTFTAGAWRTRDIDTEVSDEDGIVTISSNQFTLQAGNYFIEASAPAYHVDRHQAALYDITADNFHTVGTNEYAKGDAGTGSRSIVTARVTISSANVYEIRHRCQTTFATYGFGVFIGTSQWITDNNYTYVKIFKET